MSQYTDYFAEQAETLCPDDDDYEQRLLDIATQFRSFGVALTEFLIAQGYTGEASDADAKANFLRQRFKATQTKPPRRFQDWFSDSYAKLKRPTCFSICFAFGLDVDATNDFFRRVKLERGFDCHAMEEVVYYFCIKHGLSYSQAQYILEQIPQPKKARALPSQSILYTGVIRQAVDGIEQPAQLIAYLTANQDSFRYHNATIIQFVRELWHQIAKENGLATKEGKLIKKYYHRAEQATPDDYAIASNHASTWRIFCQIIGLSNALEKDYASRYDRSIVSVLSANVLIPLNASDCFPSQQNIDKVLRGEQGDSELMRKLLILLVFYSYWAKKRIQSGDVFAYASPLDAEVCMDTINGYLIDANYPTLYAGNPYDWLFLWSLNDDHPLDAFRTYMGEVFAVKSEQVEKAQN